MSATTGTTTTAPHVVEDCRGAIRLYSDGSVIRTHNPSFSFPLVDNPSVSWKDVVFDPVLDLGLRLYKPAETETEEAESRGNKKLPIVVYIHGGGFVLGSRTWPNFHNLCVRLCEETEAVVVAPDYRLAPENRLPAAVEDGVAAVEWIRRQARGDGDTWMREVADFGHVFVVGESAGGNIAHHLAVRFGAGSKELEPVRVRGYVMLAPFFGGTVRTKSEAEGPEDAFLNLELIDRYWRLSLPQGATSDHPLVNPFGPTNPSLEGVALDPILVIMGEHDLLRDRVKDYSKKLNDFGNKVEYIEIDGEEHGFPTLRPNSKAVSDMVELVKKFIAENLVD